MPALTNNHLLSVFGLDENNIFVGGADGTMIQYNGSEWLPMETDGRWTFKDIWGSAPDNVYTVVTDGRILHYNGKTWSPMETEKLPPMTGVLVWHLMRFMPAPDWVKFFDMMAALGNLCRREPTPM